MKHNLVTTHYAEFEHIQYYSFDEKECLLRLSYPRYLIQFKQQGKELFEIIMQEVLIHGSLLKSEIV